jgi:hypothetical protein
MPTSLNDPPTERHVRKALLLPLLATLALVALVVATVVVTRFPTASDSVPGGPVTGAHAVRYEVTGSPGTHFSISFRGDAHGSWTKTLNQPLPWAADTDFRPVTAPFAEATVTVVRGATATADTSGTTSCRIIVDGRTVAENHTSAQSAFVDCDAILT